MTCNLCQQDKTSEEFYSYRTSRCKKCVALSAKAWERAHPEQRRRHERKYRRKWRQREDVKLKIQTYYRRWYRENGRNRDTDYQEVIKIWRQDHPDAVVAHQVVFKAIRTGVLVRPSHCTDCGREARLNAHHDNYNKPLDVLWVCASCHKFRHHRDGT